MTDAEREQEIREWEEQLPSGETCERRVLLRLLDEARREIAGLETVRHGLSVELDEARAATILAEHSLPTKLLPMSGEAWRAIRNAAFCWLHPECQEDERISESRFREILVEALRPVTGEPTTPATTEGAIEANVLGAQDAEDGQEAAEAWDRVNRARDELAACEDEEGEP